MPKIKIAIADDHLLFRQGMKELLVSIAEHEVVIEAGNGKELLEQLKIIQPDLILMDNRMPEMDGVEATKEVCATYPDIPVIALSMHDESGDILRMIRAGVKGYLLKDDDFDKVMHVINEVLEKGEYFDERTVQIMRQAILNGDSLEKKDQLEDIKFSEKELEVIRLSAKGKNAEQIGKGIFLAKRSVETYRKRMLDRTGCKNMMELVAMALRNGWID